MKQTMYCATRSEESAEQRRCGVVGDRNGGSSRITAVRSTWSRRLSGNVEKASRCFLPRRFRDGGGVVDLRQRRTKKDVYTMVKKDNRSAV